MKKIKKSALFLLIVLFVLTLIILIFWGNIKKELIIQIRDSSKKILSSKYGIKLFAKKIDFSLIDGIYAKDFFLTDKNGKLIFKGSKVSLIPDYWQLIRKRRLEIDRIWISKGSAFIDLSKSEKGNIPDFKGLVGKVKHIILTELELNIDLNDEREKKKRIRLQNGFGEFFLSSKKIEGLIRESDKHGNSLKVLFFGMKDWGINGSFKLKKIDDYDLILSKFNKYGITDLNGNFIGSFGASISSKGKISWNIDSHLKGFALKYKGNIFNNLSGNIKISDSNIFTNLTGKFLNSGFNINLYGPANRLKFKFKSDNLYLPNIKKIIGYNKDTPRIVGIGRVDSFGYLNGFSPENIHATVEIDSLEFQNYDIQKGKFIFEYCDNILKIKSASFIFGSIWDTNLKGNIKIGDNIIPKLDFEATNNFISGARWSGKVIFSDGRIKIINDLGYFNNKINAVLDITEFPKFKGYIDNDYLKADWEGINYTKKMEWLSLVYFQYTNEMLKQGITGNFSLRRKRNKKYYLKNGIIENDFGKGNFDGVISLEDNNFEINWIGKPDLFNIDLPIQLGTIEAKAFCSGKITNPKIEAKIKSIDKRIDLKINTDLKKYKCKGNALGIEIEGEYSLSDGKWYVSIDSQKEAKIPLIITKWLEKYGIGLRSFSGNINLEGEKDVNFQSSSFKLVLNNLEYKGFIFSKIIADGKFKNGIITLDYLKIDQGRKGSILSLKPLKIDALKKKIELSLAIKEYLLKRDKLKSILNGNINFSNMGKISGNIDLKGKNVEIGENKIENLSIKAGFSNGDFILDELILPYKEFSSFKGSGKYEIKKNTFNIKKFDIENNIFSIYGNTLINFDDYSIENIELIIKDLVKGKKLLSYLQKKNSISGSFDIDSEYLKKLLSFDKIPSIRMNGNIINNKGKMDFKIKNNGSNINGTCHFMINREKKNWFLDANTQIEDSTIYMANSEKIDFDNLDFSPINFKMKVKFGPKVWLKNPFINVELGGKVEISGMNYPGISIGGEIKFSRGTINYFNNRFDLVTGKVFYQSLSGNKKSNKDNNEKKIKVDSSGNFKADYVYKGKSHEIVIKDTENIIEGETNIYISILATKKINGVDVYLQISGPVSNMNILLYSNPELPQDKLKELVQGAALGSLVSDKELNDKDIMNALRINLSDQLMGKFGRDIARKLDFQELDVRSGELEGKNNDFEIRLGKYLSDRFYVRYYKKIKQYEDQQQYEIKYRTNHYLFLEGLYDDYNRDYKLGLQYNISF